MCLGRNRVRVWREYRGLSAGELARNAGVSTEHISAIENGTSAGSVQTLGALPTPCRRRSTRWFRRRLLEGPPRKGSGDAVIGELTRRLRGCADFPQQFAARGAAHNRFGHVHQRREAAVNGRAVRYGCSTAGARTLRALLNSGAIPRLPWPFGCVPLRAAGGALGVRADRLPEAAEHRRRAGSVSANTGPAKVARWPFSSACGRNRGLVRHSARAVWRRWSARFRLRRTSAWTPP